MPFCADFVTFDKPHRSWSEGHSCFPTRSHTPIRRWIEAQADRIVAHAERVLAEAEAEAERMVAEAATHAEEMTAEAGRIVDEAEQAGRKARAVAAARLEKARVI